MKRKRSILAFDSFGPGSFYLDVVPTFHPPSLISRPEQKVTKLMKRLLKEQTERMRQFSWDLTRRLPSPAMPTVSRSFINNDQLNLPPMFASKKKP
jgi:hypothetical protein